MVAIDTASSCGPQPNAQFGPPMAQVPNPTRVMFIPVVPRGRVGTDGDALSAMLSTPPLYDRTMSRHIGMIDVRRSVRRACERRGHAGPNPTSAAAAAVALRP